MRGKRSIIRNKIRRGAKQSAHELASCYGKIRYKNYEEAKIANAEKLDKVKPYKCTHCPYYHVGRKAWR